MRIVVNDIAASKTGALSVLKDFYSYVKENGKAHEWIFLLSDKYVEETDNIKVITLPEVKNRKKRLMFDFKEGADYIASLKPDVLFSLQNTLPYGYKGRQVVYVHQPLGYQKMKKFSFLKSSEREYAVYQYIIGRMIDSSVKRSDKVIVQTDWMKKAVACKTGTLFDKITKVLPDVEDLSEYRIDGERKGNLFIFPSGEVLYKNHTCILKAAAILRKMGINDFDIRFTITEDVLKRLCPDDEYENVTCLGPVERTELLKSYNERILIFPSYIETFGYPLAEAKSMNGMVLASDCPFSREILKDYDNARLFDPFKPEELAELMNQCINGEIDINKSCEVKDSADSDDSLQEKESSWSRVYKELVTWN